MTASNPPVAGRIFISYRREETAYPAGWLYDRLVEHFGQGQVFKDVDSIELGDDFVEVITAAVAGCDVLLALIGDRWLTITGENGRRRLEDPGDFVRLEIEAGLTRNIRVIPVLVGGARMPRVTDLPPSLAKLVRRQALELSPSRFDSDTGRLIRVLDSSLAEVQARQLGTGPGLPVPPAPARRATGIHGTSVPAQAPDEAAAADAATAAASSSPETTGIQGPREAPRSDMRRILFRRTPRRRAAVLIGLGLVVVAAVTITTVLSTQTGQTSSANGAGHTAEVSSVAFNQDGTILASASFDNTVRLWNPATHQQIGRPLEGQASKLSTVAFSPDGKAVASGGYDETVQLWNTATHKPIGQPLGGQSGRVNSVAFSPDGKLLASGDDDGTVMVRDPASRVEVQFIHAGSGPVFTVAFSPDSTILASGGQDGTVRLWKPRTGQPIGQPLGGQSGPVNSVAFSPDGKLLASGGQDGTVWLWDTTKHRHTAPLNCHSPVRSVAFSHDGKTLACGTEAFRVLLWITATGRQKGPDLSVCGSWVFSVAFSPVGDTFAAGCGDDTVRLWNPDTGEQIGSM